MSNGIQPLAFELSTRDSLSNRAQRAIIALPRLTQRFRTHVHFGAAVAALILGRPTDITTAVGLIPVLVGLSLRTWALGYLHRNRELCTSGPYAYVRHPLYLGSFVLLLGYSFMVNNPYLVAGAVMATVGIYTAVIRREEQAMTTTFGGQYEAYRQAVPMLLPRLSPYQRGERKFSWQRALTNRVLAECVIVLVVVALLTAKEDILENLLGIKYSVIWPLWHGLH